MKTTQPLDRKKWALSMLLKKAVSEHINTYML